MHRAFAFRQQAKAFFRKVDASLASTSRVAQRKKCTPLGVATIQPGRFHHWSQIRLYASSDDADNDEEKPNKKRAAKRKRQKKITKWTVNPNLGPKHADKLSAVFAEMAKKEGFDESTAFYADDATFEDDFEGDEVDSLNFGDIDSNDNDNDDEEDFLDFGTNDEPNQSMEERIAAAKKDLGMGRVSVPQDLEGFAEDATSDELKKLGYKRELNPFGDDETPRVDAFTLITNAMVCPACGSDFQCQDEQRPGYLPPDKHAIQVKLSKIEDMQKLQERVKGDGSWSTDDEIEYLLRTVDGGEDKNGEESGFVDIEAAAEEMGLDLASLSQKKVICKRCHGLQNFGQVEESLRPGWTEEPLLSQERFRDLLTPLREKPAVIIALVDLFDFSGSVLPELDSIAGDNPVLLAANKADLLPTKMGQARAENWVRRELEYMGVQSIANIGGAVRLVSCKTGFGIAALLRKARSLAHEMDCDVYVVGAANAGKSTLINHILERNSEKKQVGKYSGKKRAGNANRRKGAVTVSPLPGTTLKFIKVDLGDGRKLYDTPGLLVPGTLTSRLTPEELKMVVPKKQVEPVTFRVASGKCVLVGGLARVEVIGDSKPFLFTFYVANDIKLHPTDSSKADDFIAKHAGKMLSPPLEPGPERIAELGELEEHVLDIDGSGWKEAAADITLNGLGWVAVTGAGTANIRVTVPKGIGLAVRPPLMPFDVWETTAKYTGGKAVRKSGKSISGKRRKGVGRR